MIKKLYVENFKSIKKLELPLNRINIFIGEPNTGKSNILETIGLLSMLGYAPSSLKDFIRFQRVVDLFFNKQITSGIEIQTDEPNHHTTIEFANNNLKFLTWDGNRYDYDMRGDFRKIQGNSDLNWYKQFKYYLFKKDVIFGQDNYEGLTPPYGSNLPSLIYSNSDIQIIFDQLMSEFLYEPVVDPYDDEIKVMKRATNLKVLLPYEVISEGLKRLFFFKTAIHSNKDSIITMEEPESYLFPYYVSNFAESLGMKKDKNIYLIATHNIYFLHSILEKTPKKDLNVFITHIENDSTNVKCLSNNELMNLFDEDPFHRISTMVHGG